jgi:putative protease
MRKTEIRFGLPEIKEIIEYAHKRGKRIFVTFNIYAHNKHLEDIEKDMTEIAKYNPDAFIMSDIGVIQIAKRVAPNVPIHISTQANTVNLEDVKFWASHGAKRVVLARELTLEEIREIHQAVPEIELEIFVHGAMCISYSGRCLMSNYLTGRNANLGECAQPCRWNYKLYAEEQLRPGEMFEVVENEESTSIFSSKDLRLIRYLPEILEAGVIGLKIEGRNKTGYYVATAGAAYRKALDLIETGKYDEAAKKELEAELEKLNYRDYTTGFIFGEAKKGQTYPSRSPIRKWDLVGQVIDTKGNEHTIIVKNQIVSGEKIEVLSPDGMCTEKVGVIKDENGHDFKVINPGRPDQKAIITLSDSFPKYSFLRKKYTK